MSKSYRLALGFSSASGTRDFLSAKDIIDINWNLIESYNRRLVEIFTKIQNTLSTTPKNIEELVDSAFTTIRDNNILLRLSNNGRAPESVYFAWMQGYLSAQIFQEFIENQLNCQLSQNGADDLSNPSTFSKKSDPDLVDHSKKILVEIQSGFKGSKTDIKKTKVKTHKADYKQYIVCLDCFNGKYTILNVDELLNLPEDSWYSNTLWEGALCYTVPEENFKEWNK